MNVTLIKPPSDTDRAWAEHGARQDIVARYFAALQSRRLDVAASVWLEAAAYDSANPGSSSIVDELDSYPQQRAA